MTTVVLPNGTEVVYGDDNRVTVRSHGATVMHTVVQLFYLLAMVGAHFEYRRRRGTEKTTRNETYVLGNNPLGQYVMLFLRSYQQRFGITLSLPHQISFRPGLESVFKSQLRLVPVQAPTSELLLDSEFLLQRVDGNPLVMTFDVWDELMNICAVELLAPMMRSHPLADRVERSASKHEGWRALYQLRFYNRTLMWALWLVLGPVKAIRRMWKSWTLSAEAGAMGRILEAVFTALQTRVETYERQGQEAIRGKESVDAEVAAAREALALEREELLQARRALEAAQREFTRGKDALEQAQRDGLQALKDQLETATALAATRLGKIEELQAQLDRALGEVENYRRAFAPTPETPPQGE